MYFFDWRIKVPSKLIKEKLFIVKIMINSELKNFPYTITLFI